MGSINATKVAHKVSEKVSRNELVVMGDIIKEIGYSDSVSRKPTKVTNTKSYKLALAVERQPLVEGLQREINRIKLSLSKKNYDKEETRVLAGTLDILIRNYQLLSGGATERQVFVLPSEVMNKNNIVKTIDSANYDDSNKVEGQESNQEEK